LDENFLPKRTQRAQGFGIFSVNSVISVAIFRGIEPSVSEKHSYLEILGGGLMAAIYCSAARCG
jgi:hypothetical protein